MLIPVLLLITVSVAGTDCSSAIDVLAAQPYRVEVIATSINDTVYELYLAAYDGDGDCPSYSSESGDDYEIRRWIGDCTAADGTTYSGSLDYERRDTTYDSSCSSSGTTETSFNQWFVVPPLEPKGGGIMLAPLVGASGTLRSWGSGDATTWGSTKVFEGTLYSTSLDLPPGLTDFTGNATYSYSTNNSGTVETRLESAIGGCPWVGYSRTDDNGSRHLESLEFGGALFESLLWWDTCPDTPMAQTGYFSTNGLLGGAPIWGPWGSVLFPEEAWVDADNDHWSPPHDCDDTDPSVLCCPMTPSDTDSPDSLDSGLDPAQVDSGPGVDDGLSGQEPGSRLSCSQASSGVSSQALLLLAVLCTFIGWKKGAR